MENKFFSSYIFIYIVYYICIVSYILIDQVALI